MIPMGITWVFYDYTINFKIMSIIFVLCLKSIIFKIAYWHVILYTNRFPVKIVTQELSPLQRCFLQVIELSRLTINTCLLSCHNLKQISNI